MMIRTQVYLSEKQRAFLKNEASKYDIKFSEMLRRTIDTYIKKEYEHARALNGKNNGGKS